MVVRIKSEQWNPKQIDISKEMMSQRIQSVISSKGWQYTINAIDRLGIPYEQLKIAEVGCGTGTFSLTLAMLGASVTLLDFNEKVLDEARKIYHMHGCKANCIKADCLESLPEGLQESFDIVISGGLAEHFVGEDREKCISYHMMLLRKNGIAYIGVPNRLSPFYWMVRWFREVTKTWTIDIEIPFSNAELKRMANSVGFEHYNVIGNASLRKDCKVYMRGLVSAIVDLLPHSFRNKLRAWKKKTASMNDSVSITDPQEVVKEAAYKMKHNVIKEALLVDRFSAGIILIAHR